MNYKQVLNVTLIGKTVYVFLSDMPEGKTYQEEKLTSVSQLTCLDEWIWRDSRLLTWGNCTITATMPTGMAKAETSDCQAIFFQADILCTLDSEKTRSFESYLRHKNYLDE